MVWVRMCEWVISVSECRVWVMVWAQWGMWAMVKVPCEQVRVWVSRWCERVRVWRDGVSTVSPVSDGVSEWAVWVMVWASAGCAVMDVSWGAVWMSDGVSQASPGCECEWVMVWVSDGVSERGYWRSVLHSEDVSAEWVTGAERERVTDRSEQAEDVSVSEWWCEWVMVWGREGVKEWG